jgi:hypothetical protein
MGPLPSEQTRYPENPDPVFSNGLRRSRDEVHEFSGPVPFQGRHITRSIFLPNQLFR